MVHAERTLALLLRLSAAVLLLAVLAVFLPFQWMAAIHRWLGLGELPNIPIMGYLTRSLSALYAYHGAMLLYVSFDVRRYLPLIRFIAALSIAFGTGMLVLDCVVGMPLPWIVCEGPFVLVLSVVLLYLAGRASRREGQA